MFLEPYCKRLLTGLLFLSGQAAYNLLWSKAPAAIKERHWQRCFAKLERKTLALNFSILEKAVAA